MKRIVIVLLLSASCGKPSETPAAGGPPRAARKPRVAVIEAAKRDVEYAIEAAGSVEAAEEISIPARVGGVLDIVRFKEGDIVSPETPLAEIDVERFRLSEARALALHDRARAQLSAAETVHRNRVALHEEGKKRGKEWVPEEQLATLKADLDRAKADLEQARVDLELAKRNHADSRIRPPIAGIINRKLVSTGEYVKPETVIATILNVTPLHLRFSVPELEAARLTVGQEIAFEVRSHPGQSFRATLFHLGQKADVSTRAVEVKAEVKAGSPLRPGTYASVRLVTGRQNSLILPERAILPTDRGFVVYVLDGTRAVSRIVRVGLRIADGVEISEGISAGDRVIVDGAAGLREGVEVEVAEGAGK